jgi:hypothetical protein
MVHTYRGREQLDQVLEQLGPIAKMESAPRMEGRFMSMILVADRDGVAEAKRQEAEEAQAEAAEDGATEKKTSDGKDGADASAPSASSE